VVDVSNDGEITNVRQSSHNLDCTFKLCRKLSQKGDRSL
jgi:hypothetical protein